MIKRNEHEIIHNLPIETYMPHKLSIMVCPTYFSSPPSKTLRCSSFNQIPTTHTPEQILLTQMLPILDLLVCYAVFGCNDKCCNLPTIQNLLCFQSFHNSCIKSKFTICKIYITFSCKFLRECSIVNKTGLI